MRRALRNRTLGIVGFSTVPGAIAYGLAVWVSLPARVGATHWIGLGVGVLLTAASVGVPLWRKARELADLRDEADRAHNEVQRIYKDVLSPLAQQLGRLVLTEKAVDDAGVRGKLVMSVLQACVTLTGGARHRACWYELSEATGTVRRLVLSERCGRADPASSCFEEGTGEGEEVFVALDAGKGRFYPDLQGSTLPKGWVANRKRSYLGFISVPVRLDRRVFGMLTVDAPHAGDLRGGHVALMHLLADLFAAALAVPVPCGTNRQTMVYRENCPFITDARRTISVEQEPVAATP